jgi:ribosomal 50S subunit-recycling heat shock protein
MRLDKFLKAVGLFKRRTVANESAGEGFIMINGKKSKPASSVEDGDVLEMDMWNYYKKIKVLQVPTVKNVAKKDIPLYIETLDYKAKTVDDFVDFDEEELS